MMVNATLLDGYDGCCLLLSYSMWPRISTCRSRLSWKPNLWSNTACCWWSNDASLSWEHATANVIKHVASHHFTTRSSEMKRDEARSTSILSDTISISKQHRNGASITKFVQLRLHFFGHLGLHAESGFTRTRMRKSGINMGQYGINMR